MTVCVCVLGMFVCAHLYLCEQVCVFNLNCMRSCVEALHVAKGGQLQSTFPSVHV